MSKRLPNEERRLDKSSLWWIHGQEIVFFMILRHLPIKDILNCRLVCEAWSRWALHNFVWLLHVERIAKLYPFFKSEFLDVVDTQKTLEGRRIEFDPPKKRRKPGGKRKVATNKTYELPKTGHWFAVKKFLNNESAIVKANITIAIGDCHMKREMRNVLFRGNKLCWIFTLSKRHEYVQKIVLKM